MLAALSLERAGVVSRRVEAAGRRPEYHLTEAGEELFDVVAVLGTWGQKWANHDIGPEDVDPAVLIWDMRRRINVGNLPGRRAVLQFDFRGIRKQSFRLVLERPEVSVCFADLQFDVDLFVTADTVAMHRVWMGHISLRDAIRDELVQLEGPRELVRAFPTWLTLNFFADVPRRSPESRPAQMRRPARPKTAGGKTRKQGPA